SVVDIRGPFDPKFDPAPLWRCERELEKRTSPHVAEVPNQDLECFRNKFAELRLPGFCENCVRKGDAYAGASASPAINDRSRRLERISRKRRGRQRPPGRSASPPRHPGGP